ncbi:hypothetical protein CMI37_04740 [Candidatus Pacearchaeota archaeon]|nr:hypothetical protein [Candidatus Pacearchaeota archaeon]
MNDKVQVFKDEQDAGLEALIQANASIAYHSPILVGDDSLDIKKNFKSLPIATAAKNDPDIHHVYSILVTTSWNKNDDVFDKEEVWASKNTPKYKPTNLEHDERQIVGGIVDNWAVNDDFDLIEENLEAKNLPDHYHILVASVIYKQWQDPAYQKRALDLIDEIEAGEKYVSMECIFKGFDYAVIAPNGKHHILARNDETAFLTQHLRSYGGAGSYQDHQVGRLLRNITFSGKGFVKKPANPESVIFDQNKVFEFNKASISSKNMFLNENGVIMKIDNPNYSDTQESFDMSNEILNDQIAELKNALESAKAENSALTDRLAEANVEKYEKSIDKLNNQIKAAEENLSEKATELEITISSLEELTSKFESVTEAHEKLESHISEMEAAEKIRARKSSLIEVGLSDEEAEAKLETFGDLNDEQFAALAETIAIYTQTITTPDTPTDEEDGDTGEAFRHMEDEKKKKKKNHEDEDDSDASEEAEASEEKSDEEVLETAQAEEASALSVEADASVGGDDEVDGVRASLHDWVQTVILDHNNSESGE